MSLVEEYEIFTNDKEVVAFYFYKQEVLDNNNPEGPFVFTVHENNLYAGTKEHYVTFPDVTDEFIDKAKRRGNILLMEFENQKPVRATPCYFVEGF